MDINTIQKALDAHKDPAKVLYSQYPFKTGPGEYAEGDVFIGIRMPIIRKIAKKYIGASFPTIKHFLYSPIHEARLLALIILLYQYPKTSDEGQKAIFDFYITHLDQVNNWDLVDVSAPGIVGCHLYNHPHAIDLSVLASSKNLWHRRVAMLACFYFIRQKDFILPMAIAVQLRNDKEDLIHKAVGWMLREIGKRDEVMAKDFLNRYAHVMPRTMLRYAIERFSPLDKQYYTKLC